jgi:septation ring formation regulator EzrA
VNAPPSDWYGVAGILIVQFFIFMQSRRNFATAKEAHTAAKEVGTEVTEIKDHVQTVQAQVTNGGTNLAETVNEVKKMLAIIAENQRTLHDEHLGAINRNIAVLNEGVLDLRSEMSALERRLDQLNGGGSGGSGTG